MKPRSNSIDRPGLTVTLGVTAIDKAMSILENARCKMHYPKSYKVALLDVALLEVPLLPFTPLRRDLRPLDVTLLDVTLLVLALL